MVAQAVIAMEFGSSAEASAPYVCAPTVSEALLATIAVDGAAIHIANRKNALNPALAP